MAWTTTTTRTTGFLVTAAVWNPEHVDNLQYLEQVAFAKRTTIYTTIATSEATATAIITLGAFTADGGPYSVTFSAPEAFHSAAGVNFRIALFDGSTALGTFGKLTGTNGQILGDSTVHLDGVHLPLLSAASHTLSARGWVGSGTGTVDMGAGGASDTLTPGFLEVWRRPGV